MKIHFSILPLFSGLPLVAIAAPITSADYGIAASAVDIAGAATSSADYSGQGSAGGIGGMSEMDSVSGFAMHGFLGQIYERVGFRLVAVPATIDESGTRQILGGEAIDDGTLLTVVPDSSIAWEVVSGPVTGIDAAGLATAGIVGRDTPAVVRGTLGLDTATLPITVLDTIADNFGSYANDGLADDYQLEFFGLDNPLAAPGIDADGDGQTNYFEWYTGLSPIDGAARFLTRIPLSDGQVPVIFGPCVPGRTYELLYSPDLSPGSWRAVPGAIVLPVDENGFCTVIDPSPSPERRFYRVEINR